MESVTAPDKDKKCQCGKQAGYELREAYKSASAWFTGTYSEMCPDCANAIHGRDTCSACGASIPWAPYAESRRVGPHNAFCPACNTEWMRLQET